MADQTFITAAVESDLPAELLSEKFYITPGVASKSTPDINGGSNG
jgi:DNA replication and repair protein RecF